MFSFLQPRQGSQPTEMEDLPMKPPPVNKLEKRRGPSKRFLSEKAKQQTRKKGKFSRSPGGFGIFTRLGMILDGDKRLYRKSVVKIRKPKKARQIKKRTKTAPVHVHRYIV